LSNNFTNEELLKGIILYGLNTATYKMGLAECLIDFVRDGKSRIPWNDLSLSFLQKYRERINLTGRPQQGQQSKRTVMERIVRELEANRIDLDQAIEYVGGRGLDNVIPRFQRIGSDDSIVDRRFYEFDFGKELVITDSLLSISPTDLDIIAEEVSSRWSLLEGAFSISLSSFHLSNDIRETYLEKGYERTSLTNNIPFLQGYQGNLCFYCGEAIDGSVHVDHVLPRQLIQTDDIWNLVLSHSTCNLQKSDRLVGPHFIQKLITRNENIMGSSHPWKFKIEAKLGRTKLKRASALRVHYENAKLVLGSNYWGGSNDYNPELDPFYRRFITVLNN
jgi:hypothetical protein